MRVIKDKFGCILHYSAVLAARKDCEVIEDYKPKKTRKPRAKKAEPKAPPPPVTPNVNDDLGVLNGLDPE